jgi:RimJ/RimL family protein N-acetyltransferase
MVALPLPLLTDRLLLRPYEAKDLEAIYDLFSREDVCRYLPWEPMDREQAKAKLEQRLQQNHLDADGDPVVLVAVEQATGRSVGELMLRLSSLASRQGEVGWSFHPDVQGRGLATEGAREVLRLGFEIVGLHRIMAGCDSRNAASLRVMERLGMRREAHFLENEFDKGEWAGEFVCAILEHEWRAKRGVS